LHGVSENSSYNTCEVDQFETLYGIDLIVKVFVTIHKVMLLTDK